MYVKINGASDNSWILGYTGNSVKVDDEMKIPLNKKVNGSRYKTKKIKYTMKSAGYDKSASHAIDYKMDWGDYYGSQATACYHNISIIKMQKKKGSKKTYNMKIEGLTDFIH